MRAKDERDDSRTPTGLADQLKRHTWPLHREAERSGVLNALLRGHADRRAYIVLLRNMAPVYETLERALRQSAAAGRLGGIARLDLYRSAALQSDLRQLAGDDWARAYRLLPSAERYAARILAAAGSDTLLIAHAYVRYLGDLNGGQILKRLLGKSLDLSPDHLAFYDFPVIEDGEAASRAFRDAVDSAGRRLATVEPILAEASAAFQLNIDLSNEVEQEARLAVAGCFGAG